MFIKAIRSIFEKVSFLLPDKLFLAIKFRYLMGEKLNFKKPVTYSEKLQWLKINDRRKEQVQYVDKYSVRSYIANTIGEDYLIPIIGMYERVEQINWDTLPEKFVIKCTHGSGSNIICTDKSKFDINKAEKQLKKWIKRNWFWYGREWPYKGIKPRIICEEFLQHNIIDYKIMCFHGEPKLIQIHQDRTENHTTDFYDINWSKTEFELKNTLKSLKNLPKPEQLEEMLFLAKELSKNEIHVRVDFYKVNEKVYFGEKTYYSHSGFAPFLKRNYDELLGSWIDLPKKTQKSI